MKKKLILTAAVLGLIAVPSAVLAQHSNNSVNQSDDSSHRVSETEHVGRADDDSDHHDQSNSGNSNQSANAGGVKIEQEGTLPAGSISTDQAQAIAQEAHPGSTVNKIEVEIEHGSVVFSVRFADGTKVDVDANGNIVKLEVQENESDHGSDDDSGSDRSGHDD